MVPSPVSMLPSSRIDVAEVNPTTVPKFAVGYAAPHSGGIVPAQGPYLLDVRYFYCSLR